MWYRKKPVLIEARQWDGSLESIRAIGTWAGDGEEGEPWIDWVTHDSDPTKPLDVLVHTLEGEMNVTPGDFIIKGVKGEYYPCKPDIFEQTYEAVTQ